MFATLLTLLLSAEPDPHTTVSTVPCQSVAECWLDANGKPIARPKKQRGRPLPKGDCGKNLLWLRNVLTCEQNVCVARFVSDGC